MKSIGGVGLVQGHGHHHALACGQAIGLDNDGRAHAVHIGVGRYRVGKGFIVSGGDVVPLHKGFRKCLGAFQLCGSLGGAKDAQTMGTEFIHHASGQRALGANHRQADLVLLRPLPQCHHVGDGHVLQAAVKRSAAVARRHINQLDLVGLCQLPGHGMLAAASPDHQNIHTSLRSALKRLLCLLLYFITQRCGKSLACRPGLPARPTAFAYARRRHRSAQWCFRHAW
jgi:hypothetical protein